jgi:hypothetical protein
VDLLDNLLERKDLQTMIRRHTSLVVLSSTHV